jgi:UDP-N-acetylglucosamine 2-epimerase
MRYQQRPEAVEAEFARIVGTEKKQILFALNQAGSANNQFPFEAPFVDRKATEKIVQISKKLV